MASSPGQGGPLEGVRVLDLANESASFATRILADLGADVLLVEPPEGAPTRSLAPFLEDEPGPERSFVHQYENTNKRSVVIDWRTPEGAALLQTLARTADVFVETERPGRMAELGLDSATLAKGKPGLIYVSVTPFGQHGEWRDWSANDLVAGATGGLLQVCGDRSDPPTQGGAKVSYKMASLVTATGVLIALTGRDRAADGRGTWLDISLQEATTMAVMQTANASIYAWKGAVPRRPGLSGAMECADGGWVGFNTRPDRLQALIDWADEAGVEHSLTPEDWPHARVLASLENNPVVDTYLRLAAKLPREEFMDGAGKADLFCLPVADFPYMDQHEHYRANDQFAEVEQPALGRTLGYVRSPVNGLEADIALRPAPSLGQHDNDVFAALGLDSARRDALRTAGVIR